MTPSTRKRVFALYYPVGHFLASFIPAFLLAVTLSPTPVGWSALIALAAGIGTASFHKVFGLDANDVEHIATEYIQSALADALAGFQPHLDAAPESTPVEAPPAI